jgi:hypothetical protein
MRSAGTVPITALPRATIPTQPGGHSNEAADDRGTLGGEVRRTASSTRPVEPEPTVDR